jgi:hypothetical protein
MSWFWYWLFRTTLKHCGSPCSRGHVANRFETVFRRGCLEVTVVERDTRQPDGHTREELCEMLRLIRWHEGLQGWRVPEPDAGEVPR